MKELQQALAAEQPQEESDSRREQQEAQQAHNELAAVKVGLEQYTLPPRIQTLAQCL